MEALPHLGFRKTFHVAQDCAPRKQVRASALEFPCRGAAQRKPQTPAFHESMDFIEERGDFLNFIEDHPVAGS